MSSINLIDFIQLGVAGIAVVAMVIIVKEFLKFARRQEDNFSELIKNHLAHDIESRNQLEKSHDKLATMIELLIQWLKNNNRK